MNSGDFEQSDKPRARDLELDLALDRAADTTAVLCLLRVGVVCAGGWDVGGRVGRASMGERCVRVRPAPRVAGRKAKRVIKL